MVKKEVAKMGGDDAAKSCQIADMQWIALNRLRTERKWTYDHLAEISGISKSVLSRLERGERLPKMDHIRALAKAFDVVDAELLRDATIDPEKQVASAPTPTGVAPLDAASATVRVDADRVGIEFDLGSAGMFRVTLPVEKAAILGVDLEEATKRSRRLSFDSPSTSSSS